jgi:Cof subfamily protein (haloacid dehalogenase superfamily)
MSGAMINKKALKKVQIVVFDLDGTLLSDDGSISERTKNLIKKLELKGVKFSIASGRLHSAIVDIASELEIQTPIISLDGSLVKGYPNGEIIHEFFIKKKHVLKSLNYAQKFTLNVALCHADAIYYTETNSLIPQIMEKFGAKYEQVESYDAYVGKTLEIVFASDSKKFTKFVWERMSFPYSFGLNTSYFKSHRHENIYYVEIRRKNISKGKALQKLLRHLRIRENRTVVIGDWYNDVSLFETDAIKVALANAIPKIKDMADLLTDKDNNEEGVAEFLELLLRAKES